MTLNPFKYWRERKAAENRKLALAGKTTSAHLTSGERQGLFRRRVK